VAAAVCLLLAGTFAWAGLAKAANPAPFRVTLRALTSAAGARRLAVAVPALELALAALLIAGVAPRVVAALALALLAAFTAALTRLGAVSAACHCFGASQSGAGRLRNALLAAGAACLVAWPAGPLWEVSAAELAGAATVAAGLACAWNLATALA
jgi:uncharacterized membrane protein YphA (DoxX/SURF4 family)